MILVTGATGFLGSELAKQLIEAGKTIRCIKRSSSKIPTLLLPLQKNIEWVEADLLDIFTLEEALDNVTLVYNCAAWVSLKQADKDAMIYTNVTGTGNLVNLCLQKSARLMHVSSVAAIGVANAGKLINESNHLDQATETDGYAISKLESEMEVWRGIAEGLDANVVNPSIIIGPNAGRNGSGALFETVRKGLKFYTQGSMGFVDVEDVARCMIGLMNSNITGERFIINAENRSFKSITEDIAACYGMKPPATLAKPWMMELAWRAAAVAGFITGKAPAIDKVSSKASLLTKNYDNQKIRTALNMEFKPLDTSIKEVCSALKN